MKFEFTVKDGRIPRNVAERIATEVKANDGKYMRLTLSNARQSSDPQRRYYYGVIVESFADLMMENGQAMSKEEVHDMLMLEVGKFQNGYRTTITGQKVPVRRSYSELSTKEAEDFHTRCRQLAAQHGKIIAEPNEGESNEH